MLQLQGHLLLDRERRRRNQASKPQCIGLPSAVNAGPLLVIGLRKKMQSAVAMSSTFNVFRRVIGGHIVDVAYASAGRGIECT